MEHHLILVLTEVLDWVALIRVAIKGWNHESLGKSVFLCGHRDGRIGCINGVGPEFAVVRHTRFFDSLLHELVEILDRINASVLLQN